MQKAQSTALQHAAPCAHSTLSPRSRQWVWVRGCHRACSIPGALFLVPALIHTFLCPSPVQTDFFRSGSSIFVGFPIHRHCSKSKTWIRGCFGMPSNKVGDREQRRKQTEVTISRCSYSHCSDIFPVPELYICFSSCSFHLWWYWNELCPNNIEVSCTTCIHCC